MNKENISLQATGSHFLLSADKGIRTSEYAIMDTFLTNKIFSLKKLTKPETCPTEIDRESEGLRHSTKLDSCYGN